MWRLTAVPILLSVAAATFSPLPPFPFRELDEKAPQQLGLCSQLNPPTIKRGQDLPLNPPVCPLNIGPYWQICGLYNYDMAADACAAYGWRLATVTQENEAMLNQLRTNCSGQGSGSWVASVRGYAAEPCAPVIAIGQSLYSYQNLGIEACAPFQGSILCEEMPQVTVSQTETLFNLTITFGQTTTTTQSITTRTVRPYHPQCSDCSDSSSGSTYCDSSSGSTYCSSSSDTSCDWTSDTSSCSSSSSSSSSQEDWCPPRGRLHHKMLKPAAALIERGHGHCPHRNNTAPICYGDNCLPVCNATINGIHVITAPVNYTDAAAECAKYGWSLLDMTSSQVDELVNVAALCGVEQLLLFVNSYNGITFACPVVQPISIGGLRPFAPIFTPVNDNGCAVFGALPVFCQEHCPFPVAESGLETGQVSLTTELYFTTATLFTPSTTVVVSQSCTESVFIN